MFRKKDEEAQAAEDDARDEHAYEDSWYRSLKAMHGPSGDEDQPVEADDVSDGASVAAEVVEEVAAEVVEEVAAEPAYETPAEPVEPVEPVEPTGHDPSEIETRAGQLLERLRTLQRLGDPVPPSEEPESSSSVWS